MMPAVSAAQCKSKSFILMLNNAACLITLTNQNEKKNENFYKGILL